MNRIKLIKNPNFSTMNNAKIKWDSIGKPLGSLGYLEDAIIKIAGIINNQNVYLDKSAVVIMCADHGVVHENVTQTGQEVTKIVADNFAKGKSSVNAMAKIIDADIFTIDIGMNCKHYPEKNLVKSKVIDRKITFGTENIFKQSAMTYKQCEMAISVGIDIVEHLKTNGYQIIMTGEMGIGNTTPTSVLSGILLKKQAKDVTGVGAGLSKEGLAKKIKVVQTVMDRIYKKNIQDKPINLLAEAGGYEIAGMVGLFLGGAIYNIPIVIDGIISTVAAVLACKIEEKTCNYILASHISKEPSAKLLLNSIGLKSFIDCNMGLGEGTGAVMLIPLLKMALAVYNNMGTFNDIGVKKYEKFEDIKG